MVKICLKFKNWRKLFLSGYTVIRLKIGRYREAKPGSQFPAHVDMFLAYYLLIFNLVTEILGSSLPRELS